MRTTTVAAGIANWEKMKAFVANAEASDPRLKRRNAAFRKRLDERQSRNLAAILANPSSQESLDYAYYTGPAFA